MWLIEQPIFDQMQAMLDSGARPTADAERKYVAEYEAMGHDGQRGLTVNGDRATIDVSGILTDSPNLFRQIFGGGGTVYSDIIAAIAVAESDPNVVAIDFQIDSPGGEASAEWMSVMDAIAGTTKPTQAIVRGRAASAAYGIASQADKIVAQNGMSIVGSIGIATRRIVLDEIVDIASSSAPNKRPDAKTEGGRAIIRAELDEIESQFISAVARGRGTTDKNVKRNFGRGGVVMASEAIERGMIDGIISAASPAPTPNIGARADVTTKAEDTIVDFSELKNKHPGIFAEAVQAGVTQERDRVEAHLTLAEASGAMETALEAITAGDECTAKYQAKYMAAGMKSASINDKVSDDSEIEVGKDLPGGGAHASGGDTFMDEITTGVEAMVGGEAE